MIRNLGRKNTFQDKLAHYCMFNWKIIRSSFGKILVYRTQNKAIKLKKPDFPIALYLKFKHKPTRNTIDTRPLAILLDKNVS